MVLITLLASNAYAEKNPSKPFKVCEEKPVYPCIAMGPTASIVHRIEVPDNKEQLIKQLKEENKMLQKNNRGIN